MGCRLWKGCTWVGRVERFLLLPGNVFFFYFIFTISPFLFPLSRSSSLFVPFRPSPSLSVPPHTSPSLSVPPSSDKLLTFSSILLAPSQTYPTPLYPRLNRYVRVCVYAYMYVCVCVRIPACTLDNSSPGSHGLPPPAPTVDQFSGFHPRRFMFLGGE